MSEDPGQHSEGCQCEDCPSRDRIRVRVILVFGDRAQVETPWHPADAPLWMPAADIAAAAGVPVNELPGRWFWATGDRGALTGFRLINDPRL